jgi:porphobilinogen synthase
MRITTPGRSRPRRLRRTPALRELVAETRISAEMLVMPHFVLPSQRGREAVDSMPGIERQGRDELLAQLEADLKLGIRSVLLFGLATGGSKDPAGRGAAADSSAVPAAARAIKSAFGDDLLVISDVCVCAYTDHGHCGVLDSQGRVDNDPSLAPLVDMALAHAEAGVDMVAPSDMMDGRVGAIRDALDERGMVNTAILSYAVKYSSAYYGPFRDAADSAPGAGNRKGYQMDPRNVREALREALLDEDEGADMLMVKPALAYLDVIARVAEASSLPLAAYNVSGEYSSVKAAAARGWMDEREVAVENLLSMRRAGADVLITYHAREALAGGWL